jgi:hypothetical protein
MFRRTVFLLIVSILVLTAVRALAHDQYRIIGTITKWESSHLDVKDRDGRTLSIEVDSDTAIQRDKKKIPASELQVGQTVVVDALGDSESELLARDITIVPPIPRKPTK